MDLLKDLNESQRAAVEYITGPSLVIAGAGSGKTRVLTYKIAYLVEQKKDINSLLVLTFTNKAAKAMIERIKLLFGEGFFVSQKFIGTFHSVFARILRIEISNLNLGFTSGYTIYDETDSRSLIKAIIKELGLDERTYKPGLVHNYISKAKNDLVSSTDFLAKHSDDNTQTSYHSGVTYKIIAQIYQQYVDRCKQANAMDFDDLLYYTYLLFTDENICRKYANKFKFILVDEYQDTNVAQQQILLQLYNAMPKKQICAVGDDSQSIYSFRGANVDNILSFTKKFKDVSGNDAKLFKLEQNYRSTQTIVNAANSLIRHNNNQIPKEVYSENEKGEKILYEPAYSDKEEALIVSKEIKRIKRQDDCEYSDFAILYRTNAQSRSFEEEFRKQGIPYRIYGGLSFYQRKEIKDVIAYFRLVANPDDEEAFKRIVNYPARGIGNTTVSKIATCALDNHVSFWEVISSPEHYGLGVNKGTLTKLDNFRLLISGFIEKARTLSVYDLGEMIIKDSGISADIFNGSKDAENIARQENLEEFLSGMQTFVAERQEEGRGEETFLTDYLQDVALLTDLDSKGEADDAPRVSLMTVHAAKGLEFATVFVVGLEENIFPSPISAASLRELEEERRLLYVAITRAEKHCILTNAKNRFRYGKMEFDNPSRFIDEIDPSLLKNEGETDLGHDMDSAGERYGGYGGRMPWDNPESRRYQNPRPVATQFMADPQPSFRSSSQSDFRSRFKPTKAVKAASRIQKPELSSAESSKCLTTSSSCTGLREGCKIEHQRFGIGTVLSVEGSGENAKATVDFVNSGRKQLLLKFAKFTVVG